jgi:ergothioneine biosynthesis protein EgtB
MRSVENPLSSPLFRRYAQIRARTLELAAPLSPEDAQVQSMPDASPAKWHLAHVTWFFETLVLEPWEAGFAPFDPSFRVLFNSYYNGIGSQHPRPQRGLITRPDLARVLAYRADVDQRMGRLLAGRPDAALDARVELGLQHEQQHQELLLTDIKHLLSCNPSQPAYQGQWPLAPVVPLPAGDQHYGGGLVDMGHDAGGFCFDNESPRHRVWLEPFALARRLVTHGEWLEFVDDGGYLDPRWWLSAGWEWRSRLGIAAPLYWSRGDDGVRVFTLQGEVPLDPHTPVVHVSHYEADAYARWRAARDGLAWRLPTEAEWEHAARQLPTAAAQAGNFADSRALHPMPLARLHEGPLQMLGDVWEWTSSAYLPYPGFTPWAGAVGEYNGKFMSGQMVLRGGSCATPREHVRTSYRNFFPPDARWQFSGLRLARDTA